MRQFSDVKVLLSVEALGVWDIVVGVQTEARAFGRLRNDGSAGLWSTIV